MTTFNENDRDQYGGDIVGILSATDKNGNQRKVTRFDMENPGILYLGPGDIINIENPSAKTAHKWIELDDTDHAMGEYITSINDGWNFCIAKEWDVRPSLRFFIKANTGGTLSIAGKDTKTLAVMWTTYENWQRLRERDLKFSNEVQYGLEKQMAEAQAKSVGNPRKDVPSAYYLGTEAKIEDDGEERR